MAAHGAVHFHGRYARDHGTSTAGDLACRHSGLARLGAATRSRRMVLMRAPYRLRTAITDLDYRLGAAIVLAMPVSRFRGGRLVQRRNAGREGLREHQDCHHDGEDAPHREGWSHLDCPERCDLRHLSDVHLRTFVSAVSSCGYWKRKPLSMATLGSTRWLASRSSSAISPIANRMANAGAGNSAGR